MAFFLVRYEYAEGSDAVRDRVRPVHRRFTGGLFEQGRLRASGPVPGAAEAYFVMVGESADEVAAALDDDPFHREGAIARRTVTPWAPVTGIFADEV